MVIKLLIEYNGKSFFGWQVQPNQRTVQGELRGALSVLLRGKKFQLIGASRTDRGVHAEGQVASVHLNEDLAMDLERFRYSLNGMLPRDIYVHSVEKVSDDFHARYSAKGKIYRYRILGGKSPIRKDFVWEFPFDYNSNKLRIAAKRLEGEHDFHNLSSSVRKGEGVVNVKRAFWRKRGDEFHFIIEADRFLYKMVRILVGMMMKVASGREKLSVFEDAIEGDLRPRIWVAPPHGLTLVKVLY